ncbi:MAG: hypothetical protein ACOZBW_04915 [Thermodesulfobacteriota bacterium]
MKKVKFVLVLVIILFVGSIAWQNSGFVMDRRPFKVLTYESPKIYNGVIILSAFLIGALLAYGSGLLSRFKAAKTIRELTAQVEVCRAEKSALEKGMAAGQRQVQSTADSPEAAS